MCPACNFYQCQECSRPATRAHEKYDCYDMESIETAPEERRARQFKNLQSQLMPLPGTEDWIVHW